jgi:hypothetical protein
VTLNLFYFTGESVTATENIRKVASVLIKCPALLRGCKLHLITYFVNDLFSAYEIKRRRYENHDFALGKFIYFTESSAAEIFKTYLQHITKHAGNIDGILPYAVI